MYDHSNNILATSYILHNSMCLIYLFLSHPLYIVQHTSLSYNLIDNQWHEIICISHLSLHTASMRIEFSHEHDRCQTSRLHRYRILLGSTARAHTYSRLFADAYHDNWIYANAKSPFNPKTRRGISFGWSSDMRFGALWNVLNMVGIIVTNNTTVLIEGLNCKLSIKYKLCWTTFYKKNNWSI